MHDDPSVSPLKLFYCDRFEFALPPGHKFPLAKYKLLRERLSQDPRFELEPAQRVKREDLLRVHAEEYVSAFLSGTLAPAAMRRIGLPWSREFVQRTLASAGGTMLATREALINGFGGTLAGGTHHAYRAEGSGFCVFNDIAVATEWARAEMGASRIAVVDLDVHQGDGTASIFAGDADVFTLSLHGARNFPFRKQKSTLDVELPDYADDGSYLAALERALPAVWNFAPDLVFFQAGVDGLATDRLGRLALTPAGLADRDEMVFSAVLKRGLPLVVTLGGGYSEPLENTVAAHAQTFAIAAEIFGSRKLRRVFSPADLCT